MKNEKKLKAQPQPKNKTIKIRISEDIKNYLNTKSNFSAYIIDLIENDRRENFDGE